MALKEYLSEALRRPIARSTGLISTRATAEFATGQARVSALTSIAKLLNREVGEDEVMMAAADVCNNVIDSYDSRFSEKSLRTLVRMMPGSGMTCGHDMSGWSYATTFAASVRAPEDGARSTPPANGLHELRDVARATWAQSKFFWPSAASYAKDLATRISYNITREVSAHWAFDLAVCSICEQDLRNCDHFPGDEYDGKKAWYQMEDVTDYIETAFVVKGGQYGTSIYPVGGSGRSFVSFADAIREVKSSKRLWDEWRKEIADVMHDVKQRNRIAAALGNGKVQTPADLFARALKSAGAAQ